MDRSIISNELINKFIIPKNIKKIFEDVITKGNYEPLDTVNSNSLWLYEQRMNTMKYSGNPGYLFYEIAVEQLKIENYFLIGGFHYPNYLGIYTQHIWSIKESRLLAIHIILNKKTMFRTKRIDYTLLPK